jgi:carbamate kinase
MTYPIEARGSSNLEVEMRIVLALGGNALLHRGESADAENQVRRIAELGSLLRTLAAAHELLITHGNGPQVGLLATETEADKTLRDPYPLDALGAQTQGLIGYWLVRELDRGAASTPAAAVVTRVLVDPDDPAFASPTKFVGEIHSEDEARELSAEHGWTMTQDAVSWRRVVPSPAPVAILELPAIADLLSAGSTVVCCGGGGIPVRRDEDGLLHGVAAVVDKDSTSALLATQLKADVLLLLTDVDAVYSEYGTDRGVPIRHATVEQLRQLQFSAGSMGAKVQAACDFAEATGRTAAIGSMTDALRVLAGDAGTQIRSSSEAARRQEAAVDAAWATSS